eukprot:2630012-Pleurochrysis_carterae.AAC.1
MRCETSRGGYVRTCTSSGAMLRASLDKFGDGMHEFVLRRDNAGLVRLHVRKSSQESTWIPEGPGYEIFASDPDPGPPALAPLKEQSQWQRPAIESDGACSRKGLVESAVCNASKRRRRQRQCTCCPASKVALSPTPQRPPLRA